VLGVGVVELLNEREGLGLILSGQHGGQLRGEGRVGGGFRKSSAKEGFGFGILLARDQDVGQAGVGGGGIGVTGQDAPVGLLGSVVLAGLVGEIGGKKRICRSFGGELEGF